MEDYEKTNAREWDLSYKTPSLTPRPKTATSASQDSPTSSHLQPAQTGPVKKWPAQQKDIRTTARERRPRPPNDSPWTKVEGVITRELAHEDVPILIEFADNAAEAAWRSRERPVDTILVPAELAWRDQHHENIAKKHGTFVTTEGGTGGNGGIRFGIWGESSAVKHTRQEIYDWIKRETPSKSTLGTNSFSKQRSLLPQQRLSAEKKWIQEVRRQRFRQSPPLGTAFGAIGTFHWPMKDYQPNEVLGNSYEALDIIRMGCSCYIIFAPESSGFHVLGEESNVKSALIRMRKAYFQIAARQIASVRKYILNFGNAEEIRSHVTLESYQHIKRIDPSAATAQVHLGKSPQSQGKIVSRSTEQQMLETSIRDVKIAGKKIMLTIAKLHYYRGHLRFRIRLGTFLATHYRTGTQDYMINDFDDMIEQSQFAGEVTPELGKEHCERNALKTLQAADFLLDPRSNTDYELSDVKPIHTAVFTFADKSGDLRLEISWHEVEDNPDSNRSELVELSRTWTRLDRSAASPSSLLDISLLNLAQSSAWAFDLSASQAVETSRLAPEFELMADSIRLDATVACAQRSDKKFVRWNPYAPVKMLQQRTSYLFALKNSNYTLELTRFQDRVFPGKPGGVEAEVYEPRWSLEVYHSVWDTLFARNENLPIGEMVDWDDGVKTWFPEDDDMDDLGQVKGETGFGQLVEKLGQVEKLVLRQESERFGGMEVG